MGGGAEKKKTNAMLDSQSAQNQAEHNQFMGAVNKGLEGATSRASDMYGSLYGGYNKFISGEGNFNPDKYGSSGSGGGGGGPAVDPRFGDVENSYRNFMNGGGVDQGMFGQFQGQLGELARTGGWSPEDVASVRGDIGGMRNIASDENIAGRMRGAGVFDDFAKTGGYTPQDIANIRARATSVIPAYYDVARDNARRMASVQGGYGPGQAALMSRLSRDSARGAQDAALNAELGVSDRVREGRQWGGSQIASAENALQAMRMNALTGASGTQANMLNSIAQNRMGAASAGGGNEVGMQGLVQKGRMFGTQGLEGMAESAASRAAAAGAASAADARWRAQFDREGQQYGLEGMKSLYGMAPGEVDMYLGANQSGRALNNSNFEGVIDQRRANNPQRDWLSTIGGLVGAAGGAMTGVGALGYGRKVIRPTA